MSRPTVKPVNLSIKRNDPQRRTALARVPPRKVLSWRPTREPRLTRRRVRENRQSLVALFIVCPSSTNSTRRRPLPSPTDAHGTVRLLRSK